MSMTPSGRIRANAQGPLGVDVERRGRCGLPSYLPNIPTLSPSLPPPPFVPTSPCNCFDRSFRLCCISAWHAGAHRTRHVNMIERFHQDQIWARFPPDQKVGLFFA